MQCQPNKKWLWLAVLIGTGLAAPAGAQTYKWTDAEGKVHYSDQPPPANVKEPVTVKPRKEPSASAPTKKGAGADKAKTYVEQEAEFKKRQVEAAEREAAEKKKADEAVEKKKNCALVRLQITDLQAGGRITQANARGEREIMSDAQISQELERLKKSEAIACK